MLKTKWHSRNAVAIENVKMGSHTQYWWRCSFNHEWQARIYSVLKGIKSSCGGCPYCRGLKVNKYNCLLATHPKLIKEWHPKNKLSPATITAGCNKKAYWLCSNGHKWKAMIASRVKGNGCPYCSNRLTNASNCLFATHPELAKQWHPTKNKNITSNAITAGSGIKVWWKCPIANDHEWRTSPNKRTSGRGCPCCSGHKIVYSNCLQTKHPEIASQWHPTKNTTEPLYVSSGSSKKYWWLCPTSADHEWMSTVKNRTKNHNGCPFCDCSKGELAVTAVLKNMNLPFEIEKTFSSCRDKRILFFDFYVKCKNEYKLIEYQGLQHYKPTFGNSPMDVHNGIKKRDQIKTKWCKAQGIDLLTIPYWDILNIDKIVRQFINTPSLKETNENI